MGRALAQQLARRQRGLDVKKRDKVLVQLLASMRPFVLQRVREINANLEAIRRMREADRRHDETLSSGTVGRFPGDAPPLEKADE